MKRTSITLPIPLHQKLLMASKAENKSISDLVREILEASLTKTQQAKLDKIYAALDALNGIGDMRITDASETIDEVLYGEDGAWKGEYDR